MSSQSRPAPAQISATSGDPEHKGAAMAMYTTAAGGAAFLGTGVVAAVFALGGGGQAVTWTFVGLYACAFVMIHFLDVPQGRPHRGTR